MRKAEGGSFGKGRHSRPMKGCLESHDVLLHAVKRISKLALAELLCRYNLVLSNLAAPRLIQLPQTCIQLGSQEPSRDLRDSCSHQLYQLITVSHMCVEHRHNPTFRQLFFFRTLRANRAVMCAPTC